MYYDKQIRYIDYLENGEKKRNCGYAKVTIMDGRLLLEMRIRDLYETDDVASEVVMEGDGIESRVGTVLIRQGSGSFLWECKDREREGEEIELGENLCYRQLERIYVQLSPRRSLRCIWKTTESTKPSKAEPEQRETFGEPDKDTAKSIQENGLREREPETVDLIQEPMQENGAQEREPETVDLIQEPVRKKEQREREPDTVSSIHESVQKNEFWERKPETMEPEKRSETVGSENEATASEREQDMAEPEREAAVSEREPDTAEPEREDAAPGPAVRAAEENKMARPQSTKPEQPQTPHMTSMREDKWQQLQKIHPHIRPFQDQREYLSLRPEDFVILHSSAYRLVQNSFLLHGYFNYDHLILTRVSQKGGNQYYIGVPGNFFEKEKQVAIMYGFESFECRQEPAQEGEFGYYMIRVDL